MMEKDKSEEMARYYATTKDIIWDGNDINEFAYFPDNSLDEHYDIREEKWQDAIEFISKKLNLPLLDFLGGGACGIAYKIPGNKVLKITEDEYEINTAKELLGKHNEYLADYYKTYSIKGHPDKLVIVKEYLEELTPEAKESCDAFFDGLYVYNDFIKMFSEAVDLTDITTQNCGMKNGHIALFDIR